MQYFSTRGLNEKISAAEAIIRGLAPDGGLYVPESFPHIGQDELESLCKMNYRERCLLYTSSLATRFMWSVSF